MPETETLDDAASPRARTRRRRLPWLLVALGAALLTLAALLAFWVVPQQEVTPLSLDGRIVCTGTGDSLDPSSLEGDAPMRTDRGVPIVYRQQATVVEPSDGQRVTIELGTTVVRTDRPEDKGLIQATLHRFTADRKTAMPVGDGDNGAMRTQADKPSTPVHVDGLELKFPFGTQPESYSYYDPTARASAPIDFVDTVEVGGVQAYHFHQKVGPVDLSKNDRSQAFDVPAAKLGLSGVGNVHARMFYTVDRDYYVEPVTGTVVDGIERIDQYLGRTPGEHAVTAFRFDAKLDPDVVDKQVAVARDGRDRLQLYGTTVPIVLAVLGLVAAGAGLWLARGGRRRADVSTPVE